MLGVALLIVFALTACFGVIALADPDAATALGVVYLCLISTVTLVYDIRKGRR